MRLFENLKNIDKIALEFGNNTLSYKQLIQEAQKRQEQFIGKKIILNHSNSIENIIDLVACMYAGSPGVLIPFDTHTDILKENVDNFDLIEAKNCKEIISSKKTFKAKDKDIFLGIMSSGSEGVPKIIWKDYQAWFTAFNHQSQVFGINENDKVLIVDALAYSANLNALLHGIWCGATVALCKLTEANSWNKLIIQKNISSIFMVPSHYHLLVDKLVPNPALRSMVSAGEKLPVATAKKLLELCPNVTLTEYYGTAELGHISYIQNDAIIENPWSVGKAFPEVEIRIEDDNIYVESPYISPDYRKLNTVGDKGEIDANGYLILIGRQGRMFNKRGLNVFAQEIEMAALSHILVNKAVVIQDTNQKIVLWIETKNKLSTNECRIYLESKISKGKLPHHIKIVANIPLLLSGKINLKELRKIPDQV